MTYVEIILSCVHNINLNKDRQIVDCIKKGGWWRVNVHCANGTVCSMEWDSDKSCAAYLCGLEMGCTIK